MTDEFTLARRAEELTCQLLVMKDALRRARWYTGQDKQSVAPTPEQLQEFHDEVLGLLADHKEDN